MTGNEVWALLAPILAKFVNAEPDDQDTFTKLYVTTFLALKEYDQNRGRKFTGELKTTT